MYQAIQRLAFFTLRGKQICRAKTSLLFNESLSVLSKLALTKWENCCNLAVGAWAYLSLKHFVL